MKNSPKQVSYFPWIRVPFREVSSELTAIQEVAGLIPHSELVMKIHLHLWPSLPFC